MEHQVHFVIFYCDLSRGMKLHVHVDMCELSIFTGCSPTAITFLFPLNYTIDSCPPFNISHSIHLTKVCILNSICMLLAFNEIQLLLKNVTLVKWQQTLSYLNLNSQIIQNRNKNPFWHSHGAQVEGYGMVIILCVCLFVKKMGK